MFLSIAGIAALYFAYEYQRNSVYCPGSRSGKRFCAQLIFMQQLMGTTAARSDHAVLILWVAFVSVFLRLLWVIAVSRREAAATDGAFFMVFARLHPTKKFLYVSLLVLGSVAFVFSLLFKLKEVISAILAMRILIQFISQAIGLLLLRKKKESRRLPL